MRDACMILVDLGGYISRCPGRIGSLHRLSSDFNMNACNNGECPTLHLISTPELVFSKVIRVVQQERGAVVCGVSPALDPRVSSRVYK